MLIIFVLLSMVIGVYWFLTDARRVRAMAEDYLSELSGAQVTVGKATLSIFEGLRLDDVRVYCEPLASVDSKSVRALPIFSASRFQITYDLQSMLRGRLQATLIVATNPRVVLAEDLNAGTWNYQRLVRPPQPTVAPTGPAEPLQLPELVLRDARIDYIEVKDNVKAAVGSMSLEGHLRASSTGDRYQFDLQSRGITQGIGPSVSGEIEIASGAVSARLKNFTFGRDIKTMLPALVRNWWEQHELSGRVDVPVLIYRPARDDKPATFKVETELDAVSLGVDPNEWLSREELRELDHLRQGLNRFADQYRQWTFSRLPTTSTPYDALADLLDTEPIRLQKVSGAFVFTESGIEIRDAGARIEDNSFILTGTIGGYSPDAPMSLKLSSRKNENLVIPAAPRYINSMPPAVRELYQDLKPQGEARLEVWLHREEPGEHAEAEGHVEIVNGQFQFIKFPYPIRQASGRVDFGPDPRTGERRMEIKSLRGMGPLGGANQNNPITLSGRIAPLGADPGVDIRIIGDRIVYDEMVHKALPPNVQDVLGLFESPATHPDRPLKLEGGFLCTIDRAPGYDRDVYVSLDIRLDNASAVPLDFPYPLDNAKGLIRIRDDHVDLVDVTSNTGPAKIKMDGRIQWVPYHHREGFEHIPPPPKNLRSDIKLVATNVPIDDKLVNALPADGRPMLKKLGLSGMIDIEGTLTQRPRSITTMPASIPRNPWIKTTPRSYWLSDKPIAATESPMRWDLVLTVKDGAIRPANTEWFVESVAADLRATPERMEVRKITGKRPVAATPTTQPSSTEFTGTGVFEKGTEPRMVGTVTATNLSLDKPFYTILPKGTQETWDAIHPEGTVDVQFSLADGADKPFRLSLRPRQLSLQPTSFPLKMDRMSGEVRVLGELVTFDNLQARSGDASLYLAGTQRMDVRDWDVKFAARGLQVNDELMNALPEGLQSFITSIKLRGKLAVDFEKLRVRNGASPATQPIAVAATTAPTTAPATMPEIDIASTLWLEDASLDIGVPVEKANGRLMLTTSVREGRLTQIDGGIEAYNMVMAGREVTNFRGKLLKRIDEPGLRLDEMQAEVAGGTMAGRLDYLVSDAGASRYVMDLSLRNADIANLTQENDRKIQGRLSASLLLEGGWGDMSARRGRGDVSVTGRQIVKLPLMLGLFQITNLALPITGPLSEATARYNIDGPVLTFERVELRGANVLMSGDGRIDFDKKTVRMKFSADNPGAKIPFIGDLLQSANRELLQIQVRGTVESPKVSATSFGTISTTVDEVFNGDDVPKK